MADMAEEGLRARKKRELRQLISDAATHMFLEHGFNAFTVADVAAVCGVSEKTVYNYFPTKESLILDREEEMATSIRRLLGPDGPDVSPVEAMVQLLERDFEYIRAQWMQADDPVKMIRGTARFGQLLKETPSLRSAQSDMMARLSDVLAETLAARAGVSPHDPEPIITAASLMGLWTVQFRTMLAAAEVAGTPGEIIEETHNAVRRAARLIESGLWSFDAVLSGDTSREHLDLAGQGAQKAARQVATALKKAKSAWREHQDVPNPSPQDRRTNARAQREQQRALIEQYKNERRALVEQHKTKAMTEALRKRAEREARRRRD